MTITIETRLLMLTSSILVLLTCERSVWASSIPFSYSAPGVTVSGTYVTSDPVPGEVCPSGCHVLDITSGIRNGAPIALARALRALAR